MDMQPALILPYILGYGKDYDIVHNPDKYVLFIDGKEIID